MLRSSFRHREQETEPFYINHKAMKYSHLLLALSLAATQAAAQTYLECDFSDGIPSTFTLIDNDGLTPSASMSKVGFAPGTPWITDIPRGTGNPAASSTSWYATAGQSDDWMITPSVTVADDGAVLLWRAMASDKNHRDGYSVYVSPTGGDGIDDFDTVNPVFSVAEEGSAWVTHIVPLDAYKGMTVSFAFVNNSTDKNQLYVDDLFIGVYSPVMMRLGLDRKIPSMGEVTVHGTAYTAGTETVEGFTVGLEYGGETYTQVFDGVVEPGGQVEFTLDKTLPVGFYETLPYRVWIESGASRYTIDTDVTAYPRRVVCEEGTGTWCGWCVRGLVMLDSIKHSHSDWAIGIAAHSGDPMANDYVGAISRWLGSGGMPCGTVNRTLETDPGSFISVGQQVFDNEQVLVAMKAEASLDEDTRTVETTTSLWFAESDGDADYRLAYAILEDGVHQPDDPYYSQRNFYSGGASGAMGGYESQPDPVPASRMWYNDVARGYVDDIRGVAGSVPAEINADEEIRYGNSFTLPDGIFDDSNTSVVVMLVDQADGRIVNAVQVPLGKGGQTGISDAAVRQDAAPVAYYTADGRRHASPQPGLNIVKYADGSTAKYVKR